MRRSFAVLATAVMVLAVMCGAAFADGAYFAEEPFDHYTISYMTADFRSQYGASSNTSFAMIDLGYVHNYNNNANFGSITITPKGPYVVGYVDPKYAGSSTYDKSVDNSRYVLMELIRKNDVKSYETVSSQKTFKVRKYSANTAPFNFRLFNDAGDLVFFGFGDSASLASLKDADYSLEFDNGDTKTGKLTNDNLSTEDQLKLAPVPYIELKQDAGGNFRSLIWRGVSASDPSTALRYSGANDPAMGIFRMADHSSLSFEVMLKDGSALQGGFVFDELITAGAPLEGEIKLTDFLKGEHDYNHVPDTAAIPMSDIVCVKVSGYNKWLFFPTKAQGSHNSNVKDGVNKTWGGSGSLTITINVDFTKFVRLIINGVVISPSYYSARSGSTVIELKEDYLKTLSKGTHDMSVEFEDGTAEIKLTKTDGNNNTGGGSGGGCSLGFGFAALAGLAFVALRRR